MPFRMLFSSSRNCCIWSGSLILISALNSVFSISRGELMSAILAPSIFFGIAECTTSLSSATPEMSLVSIMEPPGFFSTFTLSMSTL